MQQCSNTFPACLCSKEATHFAVIKFPRAAFDNSVLNLSAASASEAGWSLGAQRDIYQVRRHRTRTWRGNFPSTLPSRE